MISKLRLALETTGATDYIKDAWVRRSVDLHDSLSGQVALVTGANRGLGKEIARQLVTLGATVYAGARDPDDVDDQSVRPVRLDVTERDQIETAMERIGEEAGRLDVLVNNAGVFGPTGQLSDVDSDGLGEVLAVNLRAPIVVSKHALPLLTGRPGSRIVNVSSESGRFVRGVASDSLPYSVSKAGLNAFTDALDQQYPELLVNAACPGPTRTDMVGPSAPRSVPEGAATPVWLTRFEPGCPSGRLWKDKRPIDW